MESLEKRVQAGVALLDEWDPEWALDIDPGELRMDNLYKCVLGQLFGDYYAGQREFEDRPYAPGLHTESYGFSVCGVGTIWDEYEALDAKWREIIELRQYEAAVAA